MKNLVVLGAGTGGTIVANRMARRLPEDWSITVVDPERKHVFQPGLVFVPFDGRHDDRILRPRAKTLDARVRWRCQAVTGIERERRRLQLSDKTDLEWDQLVIATGSMLRPELTEGLLGAGWRREVFDFYTLDGAMALREALARLEEGCLVVNVVELPIKGPLAPIELVFLADEYFQRRGIREKIEIVLAIPGESVFIRPEAAGKLAALLDSRKIEVETKFSTVEVDHEARLIRSADDREVEYDLLVTIPKHGGATFIQDSGLGNARGFIEVDPRSLAVKGLDDVFVIGDAAEVPTAKAGSVAHFEAEHVVENLDRSRRGMSPAPSFDGHASCFVETGFGKAVMVDFNYEAEPSARGLAWLGGRRLRAPVPGVGPFNVLEESRANHLGKLAFRWMYWNLVRR